MADQAQILIVEGRFYEGIVDALVEGVVAVLHAEGISYERLAVPGAFEIPAAIAMAEASDEPFEGYIALGCVIRGQTSHYDYVCQESARKLMDLATERGLPLGYGILTVEHEAQAWERARMSERNKGSEVARTCLRMMELQERFLGSNDD
ncbi:MAG: 6,7-dimethyl-8-ribityllumazine synthase [Rhodospirillales bacterium]